MKYCIPNYGKYILLEDFKLDAKRKVKHWRSNTIITLAYHLIPYGFETDVPVADLLNRDGTVKETPTFVIFPAGFVICIDKIEVNKRNGNDSVFISLPSKDNARISKRITKARIYDIFGAYVDPQYYSRLDDMGSRDLNTELSLNALNGIDMEPLDDNGYSEDGEIYSHGRFQDEVRWRLS